MALNYQVIERDRVTILLAGGRPADGYRIWFQVPATNTTDYIDVEVATSTPATDHAKIQAKVNQILEFFGFEGEET